MVANIIGLMLISFLFGAVREVNKHNVSLRSQVDWLRSWGLDWRDIAMECSVNEEGLSDDLIVDLKRVAERIKAEKAANEE
jgi:hypothetical protein